MDKPVSIDMHCLELAPKGDISTARVINSIPVELWSLVFQEVDNATAPCFVASCLAFARAASLGQNGGAYDGTRRHKRPFCREAYVDVLLAEGEMTVITWAYQNGCPMGDFGVCIRIAQRNRLDLLQWAHGVGFPLGAGVCMYAMEHGNLAMLQWARDNGCQWNHTHLCTDAAKKGCLDILQWLRKQGCPWDHTTCAAAAAGGHLGVIQWAHYNGCPWTKSTCFNAAFHGHLHVLCWAHAHGCPRDYRRCLRAARDKAIREWIEALPFK